VKPRIGAEQLCPMCGMQRPQFERGAVAGEEIIGNAAPDELRGGRHKRRERSADQRETSNPRTHVAIIRERGGETSMRRRYGVAAAAKKTFTPFALATSRNVRRSRS
jgi:hypothetical protein